MKLKLIKTEADHEAALERIDQLFDAVPGTPEGDELDLLVHLVEAFEEREHPIGLPDPVEAIRFRMDQQGLKNADLVPYLGSKSRVSEVLNRKRTLTLAMVRKLHAGLGIPAEVLIQEPGQALSAVYEGIDWNSFPLAEMRKRQWFPEFEGSVVDLREQAEEILGPMLFPGGQDCRSVSALAARQCVPKGSCADENAVWAWRAKTQSLAADIPLKDYDPQAMSEEFMCSVIKLSRLADGPLLARRLLQENGIGVVVLHYLSGTHLDGAAMLRPDGHPIIALTLRHDRLDNFWFTLAHEMAHVVRHLAKGDTMAFIDDLEDDSPKNARERDADRHAAEWLIPSKEWGKSEAAARPLRDRQVCTLAVRMNVHPAIIAGRIQHDRANYAIHGNLLGRGQVRKMFPDYKSGDVD